MIKQHGYLENLLVFQNSTQSSLVPIQLHEQNELVELSLRKTNRFSR